MNGYIKNKSVSWVHCMKRAIRPGEQIPLDSLYEQYGEKHDLPEGEEFIQWLRDIKLKNKDMWEIVFTEKEVVEDKEEKIEKATHTKAVNVVGVPKEGTKEDESTSNIHNMTVQDVVGLSVRKGRDVIPQIMDVNLLKYALQEANQLTGKDSLCQVIRKRIDTMSRLG